MSKKSPERGRELEDLVIINLVSNYLYAYVYSYILYLLVCSLIRGEEREGGNLQVIP